MIKKTIAYTDFNGDEQKRDLYFNLTPAELLELENKHEGRGSFAGTLRRMGEAADAREVMNLYRSLLLTAYGERSADGADFRKSTELRETFSSSNAFSELIFELMSEEDGGAAFVKGILPKDLDERVAAISARADERRAPADHKEKKQK